MMLPLVNEDPFSNGYLNILDKGKQGPPLAACQDLTAVSNVEMDPRRLTTRDKKCQEYEHLFLALK
jgi:hypothetical protein